MSDFSKWSCGCGWRGFSHEILHAANPFDLDDEINACPQCKSVQSTLDNACEAPDCWLTATCGTPFGEAGYKRHCHKHPPEPIP